MGRNNEWAVSVLRVYERGVKQILWIVLLKVSEREGEAGVHRCKSCEIIFPPNFWEGEASLIKRGSDIFFFREEKCIFRNSLSSRDVIPRKTKPKFTSAD